MHLELVSDAPDHVHLYRDIISNWTAYATGIPSIYLHGLDPYSFAGIFLGTLRYELQLQVKWTGLGHYVSKHRFPSSTWFQNLLHIACPFMYLAEPSLLINARLDIDVPAQPLGNSVPCQSRPAPSGILALPLSSSVQLSDPPVTGTKMAAYWSHVPHGFKSSLANYSQALLPPHIAFQTAN